METKLQNDTAIIEIIDLRQEELELIKNLRYRFRFGEITIIVKDGVPFRLKKITEFADLTTPQ